MSISRQFSPDYEALIVARSQELTAAGHPEWTPERLRQEIRARGLAACHYIGRGRRWPWMIETPYTPRVRIFTD
jgi:hypothetical protein